MKKEFFDKFCASFVDRAITGMMERFDCTIGDCLEGILALAHEEGDRMSMTLTGLIYRADGKAESIWSNWLYEAVSVYAADIPMLVFGVYKYSISDSGKSENSCFQDQSFILASAYVHKCVKEGVETSEAIQAMMIYDFKVHFKNNPSLYKSVQVDRSGSSDDIARRIYLKMVSNLVKSIGGD